MRQQAPWGWWVAALLALLVLQAQGQQALPGPLADDLTSRMPARLAFNQVDFVQSWQDPTVDAVDLRDDIVLDPGYWRNAYAVREGVARLGPTRPHTNFTISSAPSTVSAAKPRQFIIRRLSFESVPNAILVETGGMLLFNNIRLAGIAKEADYTYSSAQPYLNKGWANGLWPTVALAPGALIYLNNATIEYSNPSEVGTCEQTTTKMILGLQQTLGATNVTFTNNARAPRIVGPVKFTVTVQDAQTSRTVGTATAIYRNVTLACIQPKKPTAETKKQP